MLDFTNLYTLRQNICDAILNENVEKLEEILLNEKFINLNYIDNEGQTPLHRSCKIGNLNIVKILINNGASLNLTNRYGWYPIHIASYFGYIKVVMYLIEQQKSTNESTTIEDCRLGGGSVSSTPDSTPPSSPQSYSSFD
jgi:ankyrin repeat protein